MGSLLCVNAAKILIDTGIQEQAGSGSAPVPRLFQALIFPGGPAESGRVMSAGGAGAGRLNEAAPRQWGSLGGNWRAADLDQRMGRPIGPTRPGWACTTASTW